MRTIGIILIIAGIAMFFSTGFNFTTREKVIDAGPIQISANKKNEITWPAYAGGFVIVGGALLFIFSKKK